MKNSVLPPMPAITISPRKFLKNWERRKFACFPTTRKKSASLKARAFRSSNEFPASRASQKFPAATSKRRNARWGIYWNEFEGRNLKEDTALGRITSNRHRQTERFRNDRQPQRAFPATPTGAKFRDFARWPRAQRSARAREAGPRR